MVHEFYRGILGPFTLPLRFRLIYTNPLNINTDFLEISAGFSILDVTR